MFVAVSCCPDLGCSTEATQVLAGSHHQQVPPLVALIIQRPGQADLPRFWLDVEKAAGIDQQAVTDGLLLERNGVHHQEAAERNGQINKQCVTSRTHLGLQTCCTLMWTLAVSHDLLQVQTKGLSEDLQLSTGLEKPLLLILNDEVEAVAPQITLNPYKLNWWLVYHQHMPHDYAHSSWINTWLPLIVTDVNLYA